MIYICQKKNLQYILYQQSVNNNSVSVQAEVASEAASLTFEPTKIPMKREDIWNKWIHELLIVWRESLRLTWASQRADCSAASWSRSNNSCATAALVCCACCSRRSFRSCNWCCALSGVDASPSIAVTSILVTQSGRSGRLMLGAGVRRWKKPLKPL